VYIDSDILEDFNRLNYYISLEFGFVYTHSYYFIDHDYNSINGDIFSSEGKYVSMVQIYYELGGLKESVDVTKSWISGVLDNCRDIMVSLQDDGVHIDILKILEGGNFVVKFNIYSDYAFRGNKFGIGDIYNTLCSYMKSEGFEDNSITFNRSVLTPDSQIGGGGEKYLCVMKFTTADIDSDYIAHLRYLKRYNIKESVEEFNSSLKKVDYREVDLDIRDDIKDIFLDLVDDGYDVKFSWRPGFSEDKITSGNYPFVMINRGLKRFSSGILVEYMDRLALILGDEYSIQLEVMRENTGNYYLGESSSVYNSISYRILMVRK
jgi:hypothetical protein